VLATDRLNNSSVSWMAALSDHLLNKVELPVLDSILQSALDNRLSTFDEVQVVEGVCNESKLLSGLLLRVKPYESLRGALLLFSEHVCSLELLPRKFVWSNVLLN